MGQLTLNEPSEKTAILSDSGKVEIDIKLLCRLQEYMHKLENSSLKADAAGADGIAKPLLEIVEKLESGIKDLRRELKLTQDKHVEVGG